MSPQSATPWFRFYSEVLSDRKIKRVAAMTNQPPVVIIGLWSIVLMMANDSPDRGKLLITQGVPVKVEEIADTAGINSGDCKAILEAFTGLNMMFLDENGALTVTQWNTRQFTSDNSTERVKRFRERQKDEAKKGGIENNEYTKRFSNVSETPPESESESESERENRAALTNQVLETCGYNLEYLSNGTAQKINEVTGHLVKWGATIELVKEFGDSYWWGNSPPTAKQLLDDWSKFMTWKQNPPKPAKDKGGALKPKTQTLPADQAAYSKLLQEDQLQVFNPLGS